MEAAGGRISGHFGAGASAHGIADAHTAARARALFAVVVCLLTPSAAMAYSFGIISYSGAQGKAMTCNLCHFGGVAPTVSLSGPQTIAAGDTGMFTFTVHSNAAAQIGAGFDVAASGGALQTVSGQDEQLIGSELTHVQPENNDPNSDATFSFEWQAPAAGGTYTLFGAGNSVNLDGTNGGDRAATTQLAITVSDPSTPPTPTPTATATPTPGSTPPSPTPGSACAGDCNHDGVVTVNEILTLVNIALGNAGVSACSAGDTNHDGMISISELVAAVNQALNGCAAS